MFLATEIVSAGIVRQGCGDLTLDCVSRRAKRHIWFAFFPLSQLCKLFGREKEKETFIFSWRKSNVVVAMRAVMHLRVKIQPFKFTMLRALLVGFVYYWDWSESKRGGAKETPRPKFSRALLTNFSRRGSRLTRSIVDSARTRLARETFKLDCRFFVDAQSYWHRKNSRHTFVVARERHIGVS